MRDAGAARGAWHGCGAVWSGVGDSVPLSVVERLLCHRLGGEMKDVSFGRIDFFFLPGPPFHSLLGMES